MNSRKITQSCVSRKNLCQVLMALTFTLITSVSFSQTTLYNQSFEADLVGYSHVTTQLPTDDPGDQYFSRALPSDAAIYEGNVGPYTNVTGDYLFVGSNPLNIDPGTPGEIIFDQINIAGFSNITFSADFGGVPNDWDATDLLSVEYSLDGGAFVQLYSFVSPVTNDPLMLQGNAVGGVNTVNGTVLTYDLQTITSDAIGTGSTLDLKIICNSNANYEAFGVDNITVTGIMAGGATEVAFAAPTSSADEGVGTFDVCVNIVNEDATNATTVDVALTGGTATDGVDFATYATTTVTFPAGSADPQCITLTITDDAEIDEDETLIFSLENVTGGNTAVIGATSETTVTIVDNDKMTCSVPEFTVVSPSYSEAEWEVNAGVYEANGFCGGGCEQTVETYLVYGPLDMTNTSFLELQLDASEAFGVTDVTIQYNAVPGSDLCPNEVDWTVAGVLTDPGSFTYDLSAATGAEVYISIEYTDDGVDGYSSWELSNLMLFADECPVVGTNEVPTIDAGIDEVFCGISPITLAGTASETGTWTGGLGTFSDETSPTSMYTPDASEEGTTVELTYTLDLAACSGFSDIVSLTFFAEPGDAEFSYPVLDDVCPNSENLVVSHTTGEDGVYSVTMGDETAIDLDPASGEINVMNTANGTYEITNTIFGCGNIMITGVIDGPLTGGQPKAIEFYTLEDIADLSAYGFGSANNGNGGGIIEFEFPADAIPANTFFYVADNFTDFTTYFGFEPNYSTGAASINGDDAIELYCNDIVVDVFGDVNTDGSGEAWDYLDGWAYRVDNTGPNGGQFNDADFMYSGINVLDGQTSNTSGSIFPVGTFATTMTGICPSSIFSVSITIGDTQGPVIDCPNNILVGLESGECEELVLFSVPFMDACDTEDEMSTIEQTEGLPSGSYFPIGTTTQTFIATDIFGNTSECSFDIEVLEYTETVNGVLTCNDNINVSLDSDCEVVLTAGMLLEGNNYGCYDDYEIAVSGGVTGNVITNPGTYTVTVTDPDTGNSCWSTINVESKSAPILEDCACPVGGTEVETPFVGTLDATDPIWTRPFEAAGGCAPSAAGVDIPYDTYTFELNMDATLGAEVVTFTAPSGDSFLALYADGFDPADPCGNLVITNDDGGTGFLSAITVMLNEGVQYTLVVTTFNENGNDYGDYEVEITTDATLLEIGEECQFRCVDVEYVHNSTDLTPNPSVTACEDYDLYYTDALNTDDCGTTTILRTWIASNEHGSSTCTQEFLFDPIAITDLTLPNNPVELSCNAGTSPEEIIAIFDNPLTTDNPNTPYVENNEGYVYAYPTYMINGHPQKVDNNVCNVYAGYADQELDACEEGCSGNRKVIRTWTLVDWCTLETSTFIQTIKAVDNEAPTLNTQDITVSTDAWGCFASFDAPEAWELHDNCDSAPAYDVTGPAGVTVEGSFETGYYITGAPKGVHTFNYVAYDCCGNEASYPFTVTVLDQTPPVVVAKQNIVVSLTSGTTSEEGIAKLYAESVDNGSFDGCSDEVRIEIRRDEDGCDVSGNDTYNADGHPQDGSPNPLSPSYDPDGGAYVKFCCADLTAELVDVNGDGVNDAGYHKVWLRVWDDGDMDGVFGSDGDNFNEAWAYVKVEDKLAPAIQCPSDVTLTCNADYTDLDVTGVATANGSCGGVDVEYNDIIINLNTCNEGFVRRRWNVVGRTDIFCDQTITIEGIDAPVSVSFSQVGDFTAAGCPDDITVGEPTWLAGPCDVLGYTVATDTFQFEDGACYKLVNTYTVINWCDYEPNNPFWDGSGIWEHIQVIKVTDETKPVIEDCEDKMYEVNDHGDSDDDGNVCEAKIVLTNVATDEGSANCPTGWLKWTVVIDLWGDGTEDLEYSSFLPPFDSNFNDTDGNGIPDVYVSPTANGETVSIPLPDIEGSMSNHKVSWTVTDGCNNKTTCSSEFMVVDKKAPTPYCIDISSAVMESAGTVELWAIDFNLGSFDNCSAQEDLRYTFTDVAPENDSNYDPAQRSSAMTFDCDDVANSPVEVNMYVWDEKGNADFCKVFLTLVDNTGACGDPVDPTTDACTCDPTEFTGWAVGTCNSEYDSVGAVGVIYDIRNTGDAPSGSDWATSITSIHPENWTIDQIGQIFGIALDQDENVYLAASDVYDTQFDIDPYGAGQIFKAEASNDFLAEPFVELPNTGGALNGIGNIAYCNDNNMLYASNLEDGKIYRINQAGVVMETYDPWAADNGDAGIASDSEQVWGIGLNVENGSKKLYFARVDGSTREMYSITLNENGSFPSVGSEALEFDNIMGTGFRITDIAFNAEGDQMVFAERGTKFLTGAHTSKTLRYDLTGGTWNMELKYFVGGFVTDDFPSIPAVPGENTGGGVDFGSTSVGSSIEGCDELVWSSMNYFEDGNGGLYYGMQGMNANGNTEDNANTDIIIDYDGTYDNFDQKGDLGDVEIFKCGNSNGNRPMIAGDVKTISGAKLANVEVSLASALPEYPVTIMVDGEFEFENLPLNANYEITASKDVDYLNGVSTLDLVKIQRHILGLEDLDSPYKKIAADINADNDIKASDLSQLRKLILGVITELPTNESWRFVDGAQELDLDLDLASVDYTIEINNLQSDMVNNNMVAVKVGDVTDNASVNLQDDESIEVRSAKTLELQIENRAVKSGNRVEVEFSSEDFREVYGYQFTLELNGLEMADVSSGVIGMSETNVGVLSSKLVTVSYHNGTAKSATAGEGLFTMVFTATEDGMLSEMLSLTSKVTSAESYSTENLEIREVVMVTRGSVAAVAENNLYQNEPNPFKDQTIVRFELAEAGPVLFRVSDMTGKNLMVINTEGVQGMNLLPIDADDLGTTGVLYYTIESGEFTATKKLIVVR